MRKIIAILLVLLFTTSFLISCQKESSQSPETISTTTVGYDDFRHSQLA